MTAQETGEFSYYSAIADIADSLLPFVELAGTYRAQLINAGFGEQAADALAGDFHARHLKKVGITKDE